MDTKSLIYKKIHPLLYTKRVGRDKDLWRPPIIKLVKEKPDNEGYSACLSKRKNNMDNILDDDGIGCAKCCY